MRFKLASSYSGRVLKHVYEDGQELDSPEEKYPHSFIHRKIPPSHLEMEQLCGFEDSQDDQQGMFLSSCSTHTAPFGNLISLDLLDVHVVFESGIPALRPSLNAISVN